MKFKLFGTNTPDNLFRKKKKKKDSKYVCYNEARRRIRYAVSLIGVVQLFEIRSNMNDAMYKNLLLDHLLPYKRKKCARKYFFRDNDDKRMHTSSLNSVF